MRKTLELKFGAVTDKTPDKLLQAGWRLYGNNFFTGLWVDPRTGEGYAISQAEAIRLDRSTPKYRFK